MLQATHIQCFKCSGYCLSASRGLDRVAIDFYRTLTATVYFLYPKRSHFCDSADTPGSSLPSRSKKRYEAQTRK